MTGYILYGGELSLFTRKLEAALNFYRAPFEMVAKTSADAALIETRAGTHQVPVLKTPENWMLADTTPIMMMLDGRFPDRAMFPRGEMGVLVHVLEEVLDEWVARVMVHYRWHYPASAEFASLRIAQGDADAAARVRAWGPRACRATGTETTYQQRAAEAEYRDLLAAAESQLRQTAFLLGDRPTAVDCMVLGGLRAHTYMDPDPKKVVAGFPTVVAWCQHRADEWQGGGELAPTDAPTDFAQHLLAVIPDTYGRFVLANREAQLTGAKAFQVETYGEMAGYLSRPYPERSRQMVVKRIDSLDTQSPIRGWLQAHRLTDVFASSDGHDHRQPSNTPGT